MRRELFSAAAAVISGILYIDLLIQGLAVPAAAAALFLLFVAVRYRSLLKAVQTRSFLIIFLSGFLAGCLLMVSETFHEPDCVSGKKNGKEAWFCGVVEEIETKEDSCRLRCRVGNMVMLCTYYRTLHQPYRMIGETVRFRAVPVRLRGASNPRTLNYGRYLRSEGISCTAVISRLETISESVSPIDRIKRFILERRHQMIEKMHLSKDTSAVVEGVLFGDTSRLDRNVYDDFRQNGTAHVLAVSGLHVGMLYGLYRKLSSRRKHVLLTAGFVLFLILYGTAALWSVSVSRAVILVLTALGADILQRRYDLPTALAAAALLAVFRNPYVVFGAGFQMSFLAVLSLSFLGPAAERITGKKFSPAVTVQLGLMPYMAYTFNYISVAGFLCNFPVVYLISLLVPSGVLLFFVFLGSGMLLPVVPQMIGGLAELTVTLNRYAASTEFLSSDVVSPPLWTIWAVYLIVFFISSEYFFVAAVRKNIKSTAACIMLLVCAVFLAACAGVSPFDRADMVFLDVGQGDSIHLKGDGNRHILVDGGGNLRYNVGENILKPYLLKNGARELDLAAATHLHTDHYLGLVQLAEVFPVKQMVTEGKAGQRLNFGKNRRIDIIWPEQQNPDTDDENLNSLIFKVEIEGVTALLTGDLTAEGEAMLVRKYRGTGVLAADILKIGHHGSAYSTSDCFLKEVRPSVAVISVGKNNYGHPSNNVIEKLENSGIMVYRTDQDGAVGIINRGGRISVCTENP